MSRVKTGVILVVFLLIFGSFAFGQADEVELTRAVIQTERQAIVAANLGLTDEEGKQFWPLYRDYRNDLAKAGDRKVKLIMTFAENYENLSDDTAGWMIEESLEIQKQETETKSSWVPRFREVLSAKKLARFLQIENKLDAIVNYDLADSIPLVK